MTRHLRRIVSARIAFPILALSICMLPAVAGPITFDDIARGCIGSNDATQCGFSGQPLGNYFTGMQGLNDAGTQRDGRGYLVFDLSSLSTTITSATLVFPVVNYNSGDSSETVGIYDFLSAVSGLTGSPIPSGTYADLGSGTQFGLVTLTHSSSGNISVTLNAAALAAINAAAGGKIAFGLAITTLSGQTLNDEGVFGGTYATNAVQLVLDSGTTSGVPEPGAASLLFGGLGALAFVGFHHRRMGHRRMDKFRGQSH